MHSNEEVTYLVFIFSRLWYIHRNHSINSDKQAKLLLVADVITINHYHPAMRSWDRFNLEVKGDEREHQASQILNQVVEHRQSVRVFAGLNIQ